MEIYGIHYEVWNTNSFMNIHNLTYFFRMKGERLDRSVKYRFERNYFKNINDKIYMCMCSALGYAVHSHDCVSLNIIWRWPRSSTVDSSPFPDPSIPHYYSLRCFPNSTPLWLRLCPRVTPPCPRDHTTPLLRMFPSLFLSLLFA